MTVEGAALMPMGAGWRGFTFAQAVALSLTLWIASFVLVLAFGHGAWRAGLEVGVIAAALSGLMGLTVQSVLSGRSISLILSGRVAVMALRLGLLAGSLVLTIKALHSDPLGFVLTFFPLFFVSTAIESFTSAGPAAEATGRPAGGAR